VTVESNAKQPDATAAFVESVRLLVASDVAASVSSLPLGEGVRQLLPGKMLRSRIAGRLVEANATGVSRETLVRMCAAVELAHTASLCHDDVIDNGLLRRSMPTLWRQSGRSAAVVVGDLVLCRSLAITAQTEGGRFQAALVDKLTEVCTAEAEQELSLRGNQVSVEKCLDIARRKTGALFALVGKVAGCEDAVFEGALEEAAYAIGTAYQVFDDLVDVHGDEGVARKTLGTDVTRKKFTIPQKDGVGVKAAVDCVKSLCASAIGLVADWPQARRGVETYLDKDLRPVLESSLGDVGVNVGLSA
jgi:octaprenyl-diphosphate synthase